MKEFGYFQNFNPHTLRVCSTDFMPSNSDKMFWYDDVNDIVRNSQYIALF